MMRALRLTCLLVIGLVASAAHAAKPHLWHAISQAGLPQSTVNVVVEIPRGTRKKWEVDKQSGQLRLDREIRGRGYPQSYGSLPQTLGGDGDPLDVVVFGGKRVKPGTKIQARIIGMLEMTDSGAQDTKLLAVAGDSRKYGQVTTPRKLPEGKLADVRSFFQTYKLADGKVVTVGRSLGRRAALSALRRSEEAYRVRFQQPARPHGSAPTLGR